MTTKMVAAARDGRNCIKFENIVIPAKAGIHLCLLRT